jgi:predicted RNase H-like HicB family nuclease
MYAQRADAMSKIDQYKIEIFYSPEDECFIANIPDIQFCSAHGRTHELALAEVKVALRQILETMEAKGIPLPSPSVVVAA